MYTLHLIKCIQNNFRFKTQTKHRNKKNEVMPYYGRHRYQPANVPTIFNFIFFYIFINNLEKVPYVQHFIEEYDILFYIAGLSV